MENGFQIAMSVSTLHYEAMHLAQETLSTARMLHADSMFEPDGRGDPIVFSCFNPARAAANHMAGGKEVGSIVDSNFISGLRRLLSAAPNESLSHEGREIVSFLVLSAMCDGSISPGMAFHEMRRNSGDVHHLPESISAFEYMCINVDLDILCATLVNDMVPDWSLHGYMKDNRQSFNVARIGDGGARYKSELFSTISAAIIELKHGAAGSKDSKFEEFVEQIYSKGSFAMGSLRYFALYFSDAPARLGIHRKTMLKSIHSRDWSKIRRGVLNAASDCYFASEYGSSLNSFADRNETRVFVTSDAALKAVMSADFHDRDLWLGGMSSIINSFRRQDMSASAALMIDEAVPVFEAGAAPNPRPPMRESAKQFLGQQDDFIATAWQTLKDYSDEI